MEEEIGDLLFTCVNLARHMGLDAESSLRRSSLKFERRFRQMERLAEEAGQSLGDSSDEVLDGYWERAKQSPASG